MAKVTVEPASNNAEPGKQITEHLQKVENLDGVSITPYQRGQPISEGGFIALIRGISRLGGRSKLKLEVYPKKENSSELQAYFHKNNSFKPMAPTEAIQEFITASGTEFVELEKNIYNHQQ